MVTTVTPDVTVIIPVRDAAAHLEQCLEALLRSIYRSFECVVVDDGSADESGQIARRHGARVVSLRQSHGPAHSRNRGAEVARGEILLFIDADVCVHPETVGAVAAAFAQDPELAALIGSYDDQPAHPSFLSQYKNLFHHYVHQRGREVASTFWSGCGAVRRSLFLEKGGYNERYGQPCIEDIEFGSRLRRAGYQIRLDRQLQVRHLKQWRFLNLLKTDLFLRGVPWIALMLRDRAMVSDLNLTWHARLSVVLAYLLLAVVVAIVLTGQSHAASPTLGMAASGIISAPLYGRIGTRGWQWAAVMGPGVLASVAWMWHPFEALSLLPLGLLLTILVIHGNLYRFFARVRGPGFAAAVLPFHLLYLLYSGAAVPLGMIAYLRDRWQLRKWGTGPGRRSLEPLQPLPGSENG